MKNLEAKIYGKVQGVFFRVFVRDEAKKFNLNGWVRNKEDGTVSLEAEGEKEDLMVFLERCKEGSVASKVEDIEYKFSNNLKSYKDFEILF